MCLLTYLSPGALPDDEALYRGATMNDDGHGFAIVDRASNRIIVQKGMKAQRIIEEFSKLRAKHPEGPAIFHSRWTTDGIEGKYNVHPFEVPGYSKTVIAHNGIFPTEARPNLGDIRSDTRIVAERILPKSGWKLYSRRGRRKFGRWMGIGNKVAILTLDPRFPDNGYIINEPLGTWEEGIWYSNSGYRAFKSHAYKNWWDDDGTYDYWEQTIKSYKYVDGKGYVPMGHMDRHDDCRHCLGIETVDPVTMYCRFCKGCQECDNSIIDCMCYTPASLDRAMPGREMS